MNKKTLYITAVILLTCFSVNVFALSTSQKWQILKNFERLQYEMIFESDGVFLTDADKQILSTSRKINIYSSIWSKIEAKTQYLEQQNERVVNRIDSLESAIESIDENIENIVKEINRINAEVVSTKASISINKKKISILRNKIVENRGVLLEYMTHLYKKWGYVYDENTGVDNLRTILLSGEDMSEVINDIHFKSLIQITWKSLIDKHRGYISQLYIKKTALEKQELNLKQLRKSWVLENKVLNDNKNFKERLLEVTKWQEKLYQKYISENLEKQQALKVKELQERIKFNNARESLLDRYNCDFVDVSREKEKTKNLTDQCLELNKIVYAESRLSWYEDTKNILAWPVPPFGWVTAYYRDQGYTDTFGSVHNAIDVAVPQWTDILAPADGYVIFVQPPVTASGYAYIALKHSWEIVTVHGHITEVLVKKNDFVKKWEVFAKSGGWYGTIGAWVLSTWPHLHMEVFQDKEYVDPFQFLDLSYLPFSSLPEKYKFKFLADFKERKWYTYEAWSEKPQSRWSAVFKIEWSSEVERQKNFLEAYAAPEFKDWDLWVEEWVDGNIDPTFLMCLWLAESGLGRNLKTPYNVWNVGNTDSGWTYDFPNARSGIFWITKTLNNSFLGGYTKIEELSRYGNKTWSIYASSPDHWHNNIVKCMSHIKWEYVPDDYGFRIAEL